LPAPKTVIKSILLTSIFQKYLKNRDIRDFKKLNNIEGVIVGKAIYDGDIKLDELAKEIDA